MAQWLLPHQQLWLSPISNLLCQSWKFFIFSFVHSSRAQVKQKRLMRIVELMHKTQLLLPADAFFLDNFLVIIDTFFPATPNREKLKEAQFLVKSLHHPFLQWLLPYSSSFSDAYFFGISSFFKLNDKTFNLSRFSLFSYYSYSVVVSAVKEKKVDWMRGNRTDDFLYQTDLPSQPWMAIRKRKVFPSSSLFFLGTFSSMWASLT